MNAGGPRLLLVSYHYGTGCATGGLRWTAMAPALVRLGWTIDVIAHPHDPGASETPQSGITVHRVPAPEWPSRVLRVGVNLKRRLRPESTSSVAGRDAPVVRPEKLEVWRPGMQRSAWSALRHDIASLQYILTERSWAARAARLGIRLWRRSAHLVAVVSSPPHLTQLAGPLLARATGVPVVADLRDPWIFGAPDLRAYERLDLWLGRRYERRVLGQARVIVANTERARMAAIESGLGTGDRIVTIPNGSDDSTVVEPPDPAVFRVVFAGNLYPFMDPRPLLEAVARLRSRRALTAATLRLEFIGSDPDFGSIPLAGLAAAYGLGDVIEVVPRLERRAAMRRQAAAAVMVVFDTPHPFAVPMKFYDHARLRGAMLLIGRRNTAMEDAARRLGLSVCPPDEPAAMDAALDMAHRRWIDRDYDHPLDREGIFRRERQVEAMNVLLRSLVSAAVPGPADAPPR